MMTRSLHRHESVCIMRVTRRHHSGSLGNGEGHEHPRFLTFPQLAEEEWEYQEPPSSTTRWHASDEDLKQAVGDVESL